MSYSIFGWDPHFQACFWFVMKKLVLVVLCNGCEYLENPENGQVTQTDNRICGDYAHFSCNAGYQLVGANSLMCLWGQWQGNIPRCLPIGGRNIHMLHRNICIILRNVFVTSQ